MPRLPRFIIMNGAETPFTRGSRYPRASSPPGSFSTLITSAPRSASMMPQVGPAMICASSSTRMPASGPGCGAGCGGLAHACAAGACRAGRALGRNGGAHRPRNSGFRFARNAA